MAEEEAVRSSVAARLLRVSSRTTVNNWIKDGLLRTARTVGGQNRIERSSIDELRKILDVEDAEQRKAQLDGLRRRNRGEPEPEPPSG